MTICSLRVLIVTPRTEHSRKSGKCGTSLPKTEMADFSGVFYDSDVGKSEGISLKVCAPYGAYTVELEIIKATEEVSGDIGVKIFQGSCEVRWV